MRVGILSFQGDVREHARAFTEVGAEVFLLKTPEQLDSADAVSFPGGESTTIFKFLSSEGFLDYFKANPDHPPVFATCAGAILVAARVTSNLVKGMGLLNIEVERNAYGRQRESFEADIKLEFSPEEPFRAVFIRAPRIVSTGEGVEVLARYNGDPVLVRSEKVLAATFHPELVSDLRIHQYFVDNFIRR